MPNIVVIGAGVSGLTTALLLSRNKDNCITIVAKHMPGQYDAEYASPWAGANFMPMATEVDSRWERNTWPHLSKLARESPAAGIHFQKCRILRRHADVRTGEVSADRNIMLEALFEPSPWYAELMPDFREIEPAVALPEAPAQAQALHGACEFTSVCINPALYLPWLVSQCLAAGVVLRRATVPHVADAAALHYSHDQKQHQQHQKQRVSDVLVVNCTGLLASRLGGVMDSKVVAARGQTVLVSNSAGGMMTATSGTDDSPEELLYVMERAAGGGTIIGGTCQKGNCDPRPDEQIAHRMLARAIAVCPELVKDTYIRGSATTTIGDGGLDVVSHNVGLRPTREGGVRIEKEMIDGVPVVHNYGHGGWGYQGSYGCAEKVVELVEEHLQESNATE